MNEISRIGHNPMVGRIAARRASETASRTAAGQNGDKVEVSETARLLARMNELPDVRQDKVQQARSQIQAGTYLTDSRIDAALDGLARDL